MWYIVHAESDDRIDTAIQGLVVISLFPLLVPRAQKSIFQSHHEQQSKITPQTNVLLL